MRSGIFNIYRENFFTQDMNSEKDEENMRYSTLLFVPVILAGQSPEILIEKEKAALDRWAKGDTSGYTELGAENITYFAEGSDTLIVGFKAFKAANDVIDGQFTIPRYEMIEPQVRYIGNVGLLTYALSNFNKAGEITSRWKSTEIYQNFGNEWKLIHSHWTLIRE